MVILGSLHSPGMTVWLDRLLQWFVVVVSPLVIAVQCTSILADINAVERQRPRWHSSRNVQHSWGLSDALRLSLHWP